MCTSSTQASCFYTGQETCCQSPSPSTCKPHTASAVQPQTSEFLGWRYPNPRRPKLPFHSTPHFAVLIPRSCILTYKAAIDRCVPALLPALPTRSTLPSLTDSSGAASPRVSCSPPLAHIGWVATVEEAVASASQTCYFSCLLDLSRPSKC